MKALVQRIANIGKTPTKRSDVAGWNDVAPTSLRQRVYPNVFALGDGAKTAKPKTAAVARRQAPLVANNQLVSMGQLSGEAKYDGFGSCPPQWSAA